MDGMKRALNVMKLYRPKAFRPLTFWNSLSADEFVKPSSNH